MLNKIKLKLREKQLMITKKLYSFNGFWNLKDDNKNTRNR